MSVAFSAGQLHVAASGQILDEADEGSILPNSAAYAAA